MDQSVIGVQIILGTHALPVALGGSNNGSTVTLQAESATFEPLVVAGKIVNDLSLTVSGGDPGAPVTATLLSQGKLNWERDLITALLVKNALYNPNHQRLSELGAKFRMSSPIQGRWLGADWYGS